MDVTKYNEQGENEVKKAKKALKGNFVGNLLGNKDQRIEDAIEHYEKAIPQFKLSKNWSRCAEIYTECANLSKAKKQSKDQAKYLAEAGTFFIKNKNQEEGIKCFKEATEIFKQNG